MSSRLLWLKCKSKMVKTEIQIPQHVIDAATVIEQIRNELERSGKPVTSENIHALFPEIDFHDARVEADLQRD